MKNIVRSNGDAILQENLIIIAKQSANSLKISNFAPELITNAFR